jgi:hypothetical protein
MVARLRSLPRPLLVVGALVVLTALALVAALVLDDGDQAVNLTADVEETTTTTATPSTTQAPTSTTAAPTTTAPPPTTTAAPPPTAPPVTRGATVTAAPPPTPPFRSSIDSVTVEQLGSSWKAGMGCPAPEQLRMLSLSHWGYDGQVHQGRLVVAATQAERVVAVFRDVYAARFPIQRMVPIDAYGGDDQASMRANNTSGFNCRFVAGTTRLSQHGLGLAIDINPLMNPYVRGGTVDPPEGAPYADRSRTDPGMIKAGDAVVSAFAAQGWGWGGYWSSGQDYQHFSANGR